MINNTLYKTIALGGTFDHLHDGHKDFLKFAAGIGKFLIIGVTDQQMTLSKPFAHIMQPAHVRKQAVLNFCNQHDMKIKIITLYDPFGPTIEENSEIEAIICTTQTLRGANKINEIRDKLHLKELPIHIHKLKKDVTGEGIISAERVRAGEIDRKGNVYASVLKNNLELDEKMREFFAKPHGEIIEKPTKLENKNILKIVVGDSSLETFIKNGWHYDLGIFDFKQKRIEYKSEILESLNSVEKTQNRSGWLDTSATKTIQDWLKNKNFKHIFIDGEEDLVAVIVTLLFPLGTQMYYGQPNKGMIESVISEDLKEECYSTLTKS